MMKDAAMWFIVAHVSRPENARGAPEGPSAQQKRVSASRYLRFVMGT